MIESTNGIGEGRTSRQIGIERLLNPASIIDWKNRYLRETSTLGYSFLLVLPLLLVYEIGIALVNAGSASGVRISADVLVKGLLGLVGLDGTLAFSILVLLIGAFILWKERKEGIEIRAGYLGRMTVESIIYGVGLGFIVATFVGQLFGIAPVALQTPGDPSVDTITMFVLSFGAGVYEELVFRLILVGLLFALLFFLRDRPWLRYGIAAVVGALIFSWVHYTGTYGDPFELGSFTFRFLMGLALNGLLLLRGFGIAAAAHAFYDVWVTLT